MIRSDRGEILHKIWFVILIIAGILFISYSFFGFDIIGKIKEIPSKISGSYTEITTLNDDYCADNIIPEEVIFIYGTHDSYRYYSYDYLTSSWKDGTTIDIFGDSVDKFFYKCRNGEKEGENNNYLYCDGLKYSKTVISEDGTIGDTKTYQINLILNKTRTEELNKLQIKQTYKIIDYTCFKT